MKHFKSLRSLSVTTMRQAFDTAASSCLWSGLEAVLFVQFGITLITGDVSSRSFLPTVEGADRVRTVNAPITPMMTRDMTLADILSFCNKRQLAINERQN